MISLPAINGDRRLICNRRIYKIALQLLLNVFINFGAVPIILFQKIIGLGYTPIVSHGKKCGKIFLQDADSSYLFSTVLFIRHRTIDIKLSFAYNFSRYP